MRVAFLHSSPPGEKVSRPPLVSVTLEGRSAFRAGLRPYGAGRSGHLAGERILVVDDEPEVLAMMIAVLESCGYTPESAGNAARVLDLVKTTAYDLIVTDLLMPQVDGLQVLETAKSHNPNVQVLIVTAYAAREVVTDAVKKGAAGLIEKPVDIGHFISAVREALRRSRVKGADTEPSS